MANNVRLQWYADRVRRVCVEAPLRAHALATTQAAGAASRLIRSTYSGSLARDLSRPRFLGPMRSAVGSTKRYARIEARGGDIRPKTAPYLVIRGRRIGARGQGIRSTFGGDIAATVGPGRGGGSVHHQGKGWDLAARAEFLRTLPRYTRDLMLRGAR